MDFNIELSFEVQVVCNYTKVLLDGCYGRFLEGTRRSRQGECAILYLFETIWTKASHQ